MFHCASLGLINTLHTAELIFDQTIKYLSKLILIDSTPTVQLIVISSFTPAKTDFSLLDLIKTKTCPCNARYKRKKRHYFNTTSYQRKIYLKYFQSNHIYSQLQCGLRMCCKALENKEKTITILTINYCDTLYTLFCMNKQLSL